MRGKEHYAGLDYNPIRITPAYAGKSRVRGYAALRLRNHPRVCGEKKESAAVRRLEQGSPSHMRGKGTLSAALALAVGITPAYAGKRSSLCWTLHPIQDHPRICGEKSIWAADAITSTGSPPRMRGKVHICSGLPSRRRITPAYAGKSVCALNVPFSPEDHPRVCGEKPRICHQLFGCLGSPPRMRGKGLCRTEPKLRKRITPAYAGKRFAELGWSESRRDHPRVCGEKRCLLWVTIWPAGSPPRMRGKV